MGVAYRRKIYSYLVILALLCLVGYDLYRKHEFKANVTGNIALHLSVADSRHAAGQNHTLDRKRYQQLLQIMSNRNVAKLISKFRVKGTEYFAPETGRDFLWCDPLNEAQHQPAPSLQQLCGEVAFRKAGRKIALASFPGSGNTWTRLLLEQATGVYTGAIYCDRNLRKSGFVGEYITSDNVIVIKSHQHKPNYQKNSATRKQSKDYERKHSLSFDGVVFVVRNVYDAIVSEYNRVGGRNHTGVRPQSDFGDNLQWTEFVERFAPIYHNTIARWLRVLHIPAIVARYEDLRTDLRTQLLRMLKFLRYPVNAERLECVLRQQQQTFRRKKLSNFDPFTIKQRQFLSRIMRSVEPLLNAHNTSYKEDI